LPRRSFSEGGRDLSVAARHSCLYAFLRRLCSARWNLSRRCREAGILILSFLKMVIPSERSDACRAVPLAKAGGTSPSPQGTPGSTPFSKGLCSASLQAGILFFTLRSKGRCPSRPGREASISPLLFRVPHPCAPRKGGSFFSGNLRNSRPATHAQSILPKFLRSVDSARFHRRIWM
jgi:hypothetical protein